MIVSLEAILGRYDNASSNDHIEEVNLLDVQDVSTVYSDSQHDAASRREKRHKHLHQILNILTADENEVLEDDIVAAF